jgi:hypothetical protein
MIETRSGPIGAGVGSVVQNARGLRSIALILSMESRDVVVRLFVDRAEDQIHLFLQPVVPVLRLR